MRQPNRLSCGVLHHRRGQRTWILPPDRDIDVPHVDNRQRFPRFTGHFFAKLDFARVTFTVLAVGSKILPMTLSSVSCRHATKPRPTIEKLPRNFRVTARKPPLLAFGRHKWRPSSAGKDLQATRHLSAQLVFCGVDY